MTSKKDIGLFILLGAKLNDAAKAIGHMKEVDEHQKNVKKVYPAAYSEVVHAETLATNIHGIYTRLEGILKTTLSATEDVPSSDSWHRDLLIQASIETPHRPNLIAAETEKKLNHLLRFRHVLRSNYPEEIIPSKTFEMRDLVNDAFASLDSDLRGFMKKMLDSDEDGVKQDETPSA